MTDSAPGASRFHGSMLIHRTLAATLLLASAAAQAADEVSTPFSGGTLTHTVTDTQDLWVLQVDLCTPGVSLRATADGERGRTVPSFANLVGAQAAINGDFFGSGYNPDGPAAHDGVFWGAGVNHGYVTPLSFGPAHVELPHHAVEGPTPPWAREVVGGHPTLLDDGTVVGNPGDPLCTNRHPRTAVGVSQDHRRLILLVVDGRRSGAAGMTCDELAFVLAAYGAWDAVNLDGGGSSTMVVHGAVQNHPSDGTPRVVGQHLAVFASGSGSSPQCPDYVDPACHGEPGYQGCEGTVLTACSEGSPVAQGDCGYYGAGCSAAGGSVHCVHPWCLMNLDGGEDGSFCVEGSGLLGSCALGVYAESACPADQPCQERSTTQAQCGAPPAGSEGEGEGEEPGEGEGEEAGEGEGEDEGQGGEDEPTEEPPRRLPPSVDGEGCAAGSARPPSAVLALLALSVVARRRRALSLSATIAPLR